MQKPFAFLTLSVGIFLLAACGGSSGSASGSGAGGVGGSSGGLTISSAQPASLNGSRTALSSALTNTTGIYQNQKITLSGDAGSQITFIIDTSNNTLVPGDTLVKLVSGGTSVNAACDDGSQCLNASINTATRTLTFINQRYLELGGGSNAFTVNGSVTY